MYEEENEHLQEGLKAKVHALKHVSGLNIFDSIFLITDLHNCPPSLALYVNYIKYIALNI